MSGFINGVVYGTNVDFRGVTPVSPQMTTDGQLLIGSTSPPNIVVGSLTSIDSTITITTGSGTIDLSAPGAGGIGTIDGDTGTASGAIINLVASNSVNNCGSTVSFVGNDIATIVLNVSDVNSNTIIGNAAGNISSVGGQSTGIGQSCLAASISDFGNVGVGF